MQENLLLSTAYFAPIEFYTLLLKHSKVYIERYENFIKQTYRNRCRILTANGVDELSIPVLNASKKVPIKDVKIDYSQKWVNRHWRAIQSAYGKAPFFEFYGEELKKILYKNHIFLFDLSLDLLTQCLDFLKFKPTIKFTDTYHSLANSPQNDYRSIISPKKNRMLPITYNQETYQHVFGNKFVKNLSVIDLIFCEGPRAGDLIKSGIIAEHN